MVLLNENNTGPATGTQFCRAGTQFFVDKPMNLDKLCEFCHYNGECEASALFRKSQNNTKIIDNWS